MNADFPNNLKTFKANIYESRHCVSQTALFFIQFYYLLFDNYKKRVKLFVVIFETNKFVKQYLLYFVVVVVFFVLFKYLIL